MNFYYEDRKPVLADFTLKVQPGEMIALVGRERTAKACQLRALQRSQKVALTRA